MRPNPTTGYKQVEHKAAAYRRIGRSEQDVIAANVGITERIRISQGKKIETQMFT